MVVFVYDLHGEPAAEFLDGIHACAVVEEHGSEGVAGGVEGDGIIESDGACRSLEVLGDFLRAVVATEAVGEHKSVFLVHGAEVALTEVLLHFVGKRDFALRGVGLRRVLQNPLVDVFVEAEGVLNGDDAPVQIDEFPLESADLATAATCLEEELVEHDLLIAEVLFHPSEELPHVLVLYSLSLLFHATVAEADALAWICERVSESERDVGAELSEHGEDNVDGGFRQSLLLPVGITLFPEFFAKGINHAWVERFEGVLGSKDHGLHLLLREIPFHAILLHVDVYDLQEEAQRIDRRHYTDCSPVQQ